MPASSSSPPAVLVDDSDLVLGELAAVPAAPPGLLQCLQKVADPRKRRGVRHPITGVVAAAHPATLAGAQSFLGIAEWAADAGPGELAALGLPGVVPCESTIRRCLQRLDASSLDELIGGWMWLQTKVRDGRRVIACDGKSLRGAREGAGNLTHLLSVLCQHTGTVLDQLSVGAKTNEIPVLTKLLDTMDITGAVITADALPHAARHRGLHRVPRGALHPHRQGEPTQPPQAPQSPAVGAGPGPGHRPRTRPWAHGHPAAGRRPRSQQESASRTPCKFCN